MESRWFNTLVILVWLTTTTWLVVAKLVPPLKRGDPPNYRSMYAAETDDGKPAPAVGWEMSIDGKPLGWAVTHLNTTSSVNLSDQVTKVISCIHFERIPLEELSPAWMRCWCTVQLPRPTTSAWMPTANLQSIRLAIYLSFCPCCAWPTCPMRFAFAARCRPQCSRRPSKPTNGSILGKPICRPMPSSQTNCLRKLG